MEAFFKPEVLEYLDYLAELLTTKVLPRLYHRVNHEDMLTLILVAAFPGFETRITNASWLLRQLFGEMEVTPLHIQKLLERVYLLEREERFTRIKEERR